jgi:hypothetical protein
VREFFIEDGEDVQLRLFSRQNRQLWLYQRAQVDQGGQSARVAQKLLRRDRRDFRGAPWSAQNGLSSWSGWVEDEAAHVCRSPTLQTEFGPVPRITGNLGRGIATAVNDQLCCDVRYGTDRSIIVLFSLGF